MNVCMCKLFCKLSVCMCKLLEFCKNKKTKFWYRHVFPINLVWKSQMIVMMLCLVPVMCKKFYHGKCFKLCQINMCQTDLAS